MKVDEARPLLVFDGECGFCRRCVLRIERACGERLLTRPYQELPADFGGRTSADFARAVHYFDEHGRASSGAEAVFRACALAPGRGSGLALYRNVPGFAALSEASYSWIARHRTLAARVWKLVAGGDPRPPSWAFSRRLFLLGMGLVYACAFASLLVQWKGLFGSGGILPARETLDAIHAFAADHELSPYRVQPTLFWFGSSDALLGAACLAGAALGVLLACGLATKLVLALLWALYLSLVGVGSVFLGYQWDALLLESGVLAFLYAPWGLLAHRRGAREPPWLPRVLIACLVFRLMFLSGVVKIQADEAWRDLSALDYHYWTQPIPDALAHYAHHMPAWFRRCSVALLLGVELGAPFLLFLGRRARTLGAALLITLQLGIAATGNYGFFNLLSVVLCLALLDDAALTCCLPRPLRARLAEPRTPLLADRPLAWRLACGTCALAWVAMGAEIVLGRCTETSLGAPVRAALETVRPFESLNGYGLFAHMTRERPEIVVEGSRDGSTWTPYEFRYKAGPLDRRPPFLGPHMPRLDWQMWFAALGSFRSEVWFRSFCLRLLEGAPEVSALLERDPFAPDPPRFVRARLWQYRFGSPQDRDQRGVWWQREEAGLYAPALTLQDGHLTIAR